MHSTLPGSRRPCQVNVSGDSETNHVATDALVGNGYVATDALVRPAKDEARAEPSAELCIPFCAAEIFACTKIFVDTTNIFVVLCFP
jgi:hypothetical protein